MIRSSEICDHTHERGLAHAPPGENAETLARTDSHEAGNFVWHEFCLCKPWYPMGPFLEKKCSNSIWLGTFCAVPFGHSQSIQNLVYLLGIRSYFGKKHRQPAMSLQKSSPLLFDTLSACSQKDVEKEKNLSKNETGAKRQIAFCACFIFRNRLLVFILLKILQ